MKLCKIIVVAVSVAALTVLANCQKRTVGPVPLEANDMCSFCRMSILEKRYAAELIDSEGQAFKFDDLGCLANFIKQQRNSAPIQAAFVMDFDSREWREAASASYVRSAEFKTPMNGGIAAFKDQASAREAVVKYHGTMLSFTELTK